MGNIVWTRPWPWKLGAMRQDTETVFCGFHDPVTGIFVKKMLFV